MAFCKQHPFVGGDKTVLVDTGYWSHSEQTVALIEDTLGTAELDVIVNSHLHSDHCGGNAALQGRYPHSQTWIPPGQALHVSDWDPDALSYTPTGQYCPRFRFDETLRPGKTVRFGVTDWEVHSAAGHDPHSVIFFEPEKRLLISADALWENGFGVVFPELEGKDAFVHVSHTLDLIEHLNPKVVIPGHGSVFSYRKSVMLAARQRLQSFIKDPPKHARHAAKVLLKFKLLEVQRQEYEKFVDWAVTTPYFSKIDSNFFGNRALRSWIDHLCDGLIRSKVAKMESSYIVNA